MDVDIDAAAYVVVYLLIIPIMMRVETCRCQWNRGADDGKLKRYTSLRGRESEIYQPERFSYQYIQLPEWL